MLIDSLLVERYHAAAMMRNDFQIGVFFQNAAKNKTSHCDCSLIRPTEGAGNIVFGDLFNRIVSEIIASPWMYVDGEIVFRHFVPQGKELRGIQRFAVDIAMDVYAPEA